MTELAKTPLYDAHVELGGKIVPFAGYAMPVQYKAGVLKEYQCVRGDGAGLFDISHMGQVRVQGDQALAFLQYATSNDVSLLTDGQVQYSALLNAEGTFIDDITTYKVADHHYYLCINAANRHKDVAHLESLAADYAVCVIDESDDTTLLALQGEKAQAYLQTLTDTVLDDITYYHFASCSLQCAGETISALISRTGYTGEDGFELYLPNAAARSVWGSLLAAGAEPIGLAARDMLRTEMGYALYGHEISDDVTPVEAKLMWITRMNKGDFLGRDAVLLRREMGAQRNLLALKLTQRGIPREGYRVLVDGEVVGEVTSGQHSPLAEAGVALVYVEPLYADRECFDIEIRGKAVAARRTNLPFVRSRVRRKS